MSRPSRVDQHNQRARIRAALIRGDTFPSISKKYGISQAALKRYMYDKLAPQAAAAVVKREEMDQGFVIEQIDKILARLWKFAQAVDDELQDPSNPEKYYLGPRATEVDIVYLYKDPKDKTDVPPAKGKANLQTLLGRLEKNGYTPLGVESKYADPRELHIKNATALTKAIDSVARLLGMVKEIKVNVTHTQEWLIIKQTIVQATKEWPGVREKLVAAFDELVERTENTD